MFFQGDRHCEHQLHWEEDTLFIRMWYGPTVLTIRSESVILWLRVWVDYAISIPFPLFFGNKTEPFLWFRQRIEQNSSSKQNYFVRCGNRPSNAIFVQVSIAGKGCQWDVDTSLSAEMLWNLSTEAWFSSFFLSPGIDGWSCTSHLSTVRWLWMKAAHQGRQHKK